MTVGTDGTIYGVRDNALYSVSPVGAFRFLHRSRNPLERARWGSGLQRFVQWHDGNFYGTATLAGGKVYRLNRERTACANEVSLSFSGTGAAATLRVNHVLKTESVAIAGLFLRTQFGVQPLWLSALPPVTPTIVYELPLAPFPAIGTVGVYSFIITSDLKSCSSSATVETGGTSPD